MTLFVTAYRDVLISGSFPIPRYWLALSIAVMISLALGYFPFLRVKKRLAEEL